MAEKNCFLIVLWLVLLRGSSLGVVGNPEGDALIEFKNAVSSSSDSMQSWDSNLGSPCTWFHVTCSPDGSVTRVDLGNANLTGRLVPDLGKLPNLLYLELYNNKLSGGIPDELGNLSNLVTLDLYANNLTGPIPNTLGNLKLLGFLRLNNNSLSSSIPMSLTNISSLQVLDLSYNNLSGIIPIEGSFSRFTNISFSGNMNLSYAPTPPPPPSSLASPPSTKSRTEIIAGVVAAGTAILFAAPLLLICLWRNRRAPVHFFDIPGEEEPQVHLGQLKRFSLRELQVATDNFSPKNILGKGGFGKVYKGRLADGSLVAVKRLKEERTQGGEMQFQMEIEMISLAVHRNLLKLHGFCMTPTERLLVYPYMPNGSVASRLRGSATERRDGQPPLEWSIRKHIAWGAANGLAYLHEHCNPKIIHRDVKAANVLLDDDFEPVVGDFGLAKMMNYRDTHVTTAVRGTIGHIAPEYLSTGVASDKSDVFGYGIMLLELLTGQRAFDLARLANDEDIMLLDWVKEILKERRLEVLLDPDIVGNYSEQEVENLIQVALLCTQVNASERPKMSEVVGILEGEGLAEKWEEWQKEEMLQAAAHPERRNHYLHFPDSSSRILDDQLSGPR